MAKILFGMMMTDARGKLGGQVFSKNRAGAYVRTKVTPVNPRTASQMLGRSILANVSTAWSGLTQAQRDSWNNAVDDWQKTDIFGNLRRPSGKNLHSSLNKNLLSAGLSAITTAPAKVEVPTFPTLSVSVDISDAEISLNNVSVPVGAKLQIESTGAVSAGTSFVENMYRVIGYDETEAVVFSDYLAKFGTIQVGQRIFFRVKLIMPNGQAGVPVTALATIQA